MVKIDENFFSSKHDKGFSMVYSSLAFAKFLSEDKTGVDLVLFRGAQSTLNQNIFSHGIKILKLEKIS